MLALGGRTINDADRMADFEAALAKIANAAKRAGIGAGIHTTAGDIAATRLSEGYTFASISSDLNHLDKIAGDHLRAARV
ncbi:hypothetical protein NKY70_29975 [Sinorhizobium meliloti]|uniref:hypothetical protein n=1 Tax=Rhizobium meliloti TaxID=382 RepID=UPI00299D1B84